MSGLVTSVWRASHDYIHYIREFQARDNEKTRPIIYTWWHWRNQLKYIQTAQYSMNMNPQLGAWPHLTCVLPSNVIGRLSCLRLVTGLGNIGGNCIQTGASLYPEYLLSPPALGYARPGDFMRIWKSNSSGNSATFSSCHSAATAVTRRAGTGNNIYEISLHSSH